MWGATSRRQIWHRWQTYFNPRTPCGVRPSQPCDYLLDINISIHAPRVGCDSIILESSESKCRISIHAPRVGCDGIGGGHGSGLLDISIHAPRVGCDHAGRFVPTMHRDFNPRTPCGVRPDGTWGERKELTVFQSTHPVWGATANPV